MAPSVIIVLYVCVGILAAAGSIFISQKLFSAKAEQIFFALFLVAIAAFYLAFPAYFADEEAWRFETMAVVLFAIFGLVGLRVPSLLIVGYLLHGVWTYFMSFMLLAQRTSSACTDLPRFRWRTVLFA